MMKMEAGQPPYFEWIKDNLPKGSTIGVDEGQIPAKSFEQRQKYFKDNGINLVGISENLVDEVWADEKPAMPEEKVWVLEDQFTGEHTLEKFKRISEKMDKKASMMLLTTLDDIAWVLNLRGNDIEFNPLFFSYLLLQKTDSGMKGHLFIKEDKVADVKDYLASINVAVSDYSGLEAAIKELSNEENKHISINKGQCSQRLVQVLNNFDFSVVEESGIVELMKSKKNPVMQEGMRQANIRDCAAIMKYFAFLEEELRKPDHTLDEFTGARKVEEYRTFGQYYKGPSFDSISSIGPNGAVIHYKPSKEEALKLNNDEIYLLDSGGQYLDGTTDITRTAHFGGKAPTPF